ncbi:MAG: prepilin-type N-terminal cleavage/methylation domain-containing protein [Verrucomicrobia bacterium]|nr:prepilin-type N-terminal cleavage/methylation domain-containing protein [Verrucomicrobiota bacterium]MCF7708821.1 prepilin-type N-terminal cleavage/methylation domain-containing protein [Verrucomicrobiota bacterium]
MNILKHNIYHKYYNVSCAFTLIELIMVLAIVGVLASLLMTAITKARRYAERIYCQNNQRQLGLALNQYAHDNKTYPPLLCLDNGEADVRYDTIQLTLWNAYILPYVSSNNKVFNCPSYREIFRWKKEYNPPRKYSSNITYAGENELSKYKYPYNIACGRMLSYAINMYGVSEEIHARSVNAYGLWGGCISKENSKNTRCIYEGRKMDELRAPANMIAIGDGPCEYKRYIHAVMGPDSVNRYSPVRANYNNNGIYKPIMERHLEYNRNEEDNMWIGTLHDNGANMVYVDGHVEWKKTDIWLELSYKNAKRWNYDNQPHKELWK